MLVTELTSHRDISALKDALTLNSSLMLVTSDTSQLAISTVPAAPQSAPWLQHATPVGSTPRQLSTAAFSAARSGNVHPVSTPSAGSSPAALVPPPEQGAHSPFSTRSFSRHGLNTHAPGGPSVVFSVSSREARESHVSAPVNIPVVFALLGKVHSSMSCRKLDLPMNRSCAAATCDTSQSGMSTHPTAPHRLIAGSGCKHSLSEEQHLSPDGTASKHASTVAFSSAPSVNGQTHVAFVSIRLVHVVTPFSTYTASHVGTQDVPLTRVSVQLPTAPLRGGRDASHALSLRVHPPPGRVWSLPPVNLAFHASAELNIPSEFVTLDVSQPSGILLNASALSNMCLMVVTELTSHLDRC